MAAMAGETDSVFEHFEVWALGSWETVLGVGDGPLAMLQ